MFGKQRGKQVQWLMRCALRSQAVATDLADQRRGSGTSDIQHLVAEIKACRTLERGKQIHAEAMRDGSLFNIYVANTLVSMYARYGCMERARQAFAFIKTPSVVSWNALILGYAVNGEGLAALELLSSMRSQGCTPNSVTLIAALKACASLTMKQGDDDGQTKCRGIGKQIHQLASELGCDGDFKVQSSLIDMYAKCGSMDECLRVFSDVKHPDVVSWSALIFGYAANGEGRVALELFARMRSQGCIPNSRTFVAVVKACASLAFKRECSRTECLEWGKQIHLLASEMGCDSNIHVQSSLIDMYAKCGSMVDAMEVFKTMNHPDVVAWTALILGYATNGDGVAALEMFTRMSSQGCAPNSITFAAALKACGFLGALEFGKNIHATLQRSVELDLILVNCLVDFYSKCGSLVEAHEVFDSNTRTRDLTTWTSLLAGYSRLGDTRAVFALFERMQDSGLKPDGVTFTCILTCCSHAGFVEQGRDCFEAMVTKHGIVPTIEHYTCMVDILGRSNKLEEAIGVVQSMPWSPDAVTWMTVLSACRKWKNVEIGKLAFKSLVSLDDRDATAYVLMGQIYASVGMFEEQEAVLGMRRELKASKKPGQSWWTSEAGEVHTFLVGESKHGDQ